MKNIKTDYIPDKEPGKLFLCAVAMVSFSVLALQLGLVRLFSVMVWYHFTFMIISLALLGYGASGSFLALFGKKINADNSPELYIYSTFFAGISVILSYIFICIFPPDPFSLLSGEADTAVKILTKWVLFITNYLLLLLPFFLAGLAISGAVSFYPQNVNRVYFADLSGAGAGCIGMLFMMSILGGERSVLLCGFILILCSLLFNISFGKSGKSSGKKVSGIIFAVMILSILAVYLVPLKMNVPIAPTKALKSVIDNPEQKILYTKWNAISRIDVFSTLDCLLPWRVSSAYKGGYPRGKGLMIDADAFTPIAADDGDVKEKEILNYTITSFAYQFGKRESALIIGPGGGMDILTADYNKIKDITGVELNPLVVKIVGDEHKEFNKNLYHREHIKILSDEGRSFVKRSRKKYDLIQIPLVDTWAALASGAYSLSENYLYTTDAIEDYWNHLTDDGALSIIRWSGNPPGGLLRLCANTYYTFQKLNIPNPEKHILICADGNLTNFIINKKPFSNQEILKIKELIKKYQYAIRYSFFEKGLTIPYVYGLGYNPVSKPAETLSDDIPSTQTYFTGIKRGEFKSAIIEPYKVVELRSFPERYAFLNAACEREGVIPIYISGCDGINDFEKFFLYKDKNEFYDDYPVNVSPTTDESPFFFQDFKFSINHPDLGFFKRLSVLGLSSLLSQAGILAILVLFIIAFVLSALLILLPLFIGSKDALKTRNKWSFFSYFACLGFAYIFVEISQIQRYILFLGQPVYSISIVLFTFLTSSGIGSRISGSMKGSVEKTIRMGAAGVFVLAVFYYFFQRPIFSIFLPYSFTLRVAVSIIMLFPLGFFMGTLFPAGVKAAGQINKKVLPWLWAVNGICSVLGSILASFLAMQIGFSNLLMLAGVFYLISLITLKKMCR